MGSEVARIRERSKSRKLLESLPPSGSTPAPLSRSTSCSRIRATSRPHVCMNHWASPQSIRPWASSSRSTSAAKPVCSASTLPAISPTLSWLLSARLHGKARWRVSSPSSRCWLESTDTLLRLSQASEGCFEAASITPFSISQ